MSLEKELPKADFRRRTIILTYNPNSTANSQRLYEWAFSNIIRPDLDHVCLFSVLQIEREYIPVINDLWTFGLAGYAITYNTAQYYEEYQNYIKNEQESVKKTFQIISRELAAKNITSNTIIVRGNVREELLKVCESVNPDIVLIGSTPSKSRIRNKLLNKSTLSYIKNKVRNNVSVLSDSDHEEFIRNKINKINEPKVSKKGICRVIQKMVKQVKPKSRKTDTAINKTYHKLED